jgi:diaminopimelate decarboxylase
MNKYFKFPIEKFKLKETPFYYYDEDLLRDTLKSLIEQIKDKPFIIHYAIKANHNLKILKIIKEFEIGVDTVSGGEIKCALEAGFSSEKIVFAGVGKTEKEINYAIDNNIYCFNVESIPELESINEIAKNKNKIVNIAFRINPNIDAHTHKYITTGINDNKFGIYLQDIDNIINDVLNDKEKYSNVKFIGIHFHIGSQILDVNNFNPLVNLINEMQEKFKEKKIELTYIDVGGGLGIDYETPEKNPIPNFKEYFELYSKINLLPNQKIHFELGRSIICQCGSMISKVTYIKKSPNKNFAIMDAGMTDLIRPALYQAIHQIRNLNNLNGEKEKYDVVGPICESSDVFIQDYFMGKAKKGDYFAFLSAGAYGESMASMYNARELIKGYLSSEF